MEPKTFADLGLIKELCDACERLGYKEPTEIQKRSIPLALAQKDVIGLAQTGSGKTAAFVLPIIQALWNDPRPFFACILAPTRELVHQISEQILALGGGIGVKTAVLIGGIEMMKQSIVLSQRPHIIVGTPGRLHDHLKNTKGFDLKRVKYLVLDEADRLLDLDFGPKIEEILATLPCSSESQRRTLLFSATMTDKVAKLQRASISGTPERVSVSETRYSTVETLLQYYLFFPLKYKDAYLAYLINEHIGHSTIVFATNVITVQRLAFLLRNLGFPAIAIHGQMQQSSRLTALSKFKSGARNVLVASDVIARGLDIPSVDLVINYDVPTNSKVYVHRVGRTARAGRTGKAITFVTQYDVEMYQKIESLLNKKLPQFEVSSEEVMVFCDRVAEAGAIAASQLRELASKSKIFKAGGKLLEDEIK